MPFPDSGHRWHDVVLHDGEPRGERTWRGRTRHVFDELERWEPSETPTLTVAVEAPDPAAAEALVDLAHERGWAAEDWSGNVRMLCRACSEAHVEAERPDAPAWRTHRHVGVAAPLADAEQLLADWARGGPAQSHGEPVLGF